MEDKKGIQTKHLIDHVLEVQKYVVHNKTNYKSIYNKDTIVYLCFFHRININVDFLETKFTYVIAPFQEYVH